MIPNNMVATRNSENENNRVGSKRVFLPRQSKLASMKKSNQNWETSNSKLVDVTSRQTRSTKPSKRTLSGVDVFENTLPLTEREKTFATNNPRRIVCEWHKVSGHFPGRTQTFVMKQMGIKSSAENNGKDMDLVIKLSKISQPPQLPFTTGVVDEETLDFFLELVPTPLGSKHAHVEDLIELLGQSHHFM